MKHLKEIEEYAQRCLVTQREHQGYLDGKISRTRSWDHYWDGRWSDIRSFGSGPWFHYPEQPEIEDGFKRVCKKYADDKMRNEKAFFKGEISREKFQEISSSLRKGLLLDLESLNNRVYSDFHLFIRSAIAWGIPICVVVIPLLSACFM